MDDLTIRECAENLISAGIGLSSTHPIGPRITDRARAIIHILDNAEGILDGWQQGYIPGVVEIADPEHPTHHA